MALVAFLPCRVNMVSPWNDIDKGSSGILRKTDGYHTVYTCLSKLLNSAILRFKNIHMYNKFYQDSCL